MIAIQLRDPRWVYYKLALWVPIRVDYLGEAAFVMSLLFAITLIFCLLGVVSSRARLPVGISMIPADIALAS